MHRGHGKSRARIPTVWLLTDARVAEADLARAIERLPRGAALVVRHYALPGPDRRALFARLGARARRRGVVRLLAGDPATARDWGADGHHGPAPRPPGARRAWLHSAPVHDMAQLRAACRAGADAVLISPLMRTRSHPGARPLGPARFAALARLARMPGIALGGVAPRHSALVRRLGAHGFAAIDGLVGRCRR
jgi:thiamine-phosphate pyrophosphorylase